MTLIRYRLALIVSTLTVVLSSVACNQQDAESEEHNRQAVLLESKEKILRLRKALQKSPQDPKIHMQLGDLLAKRGEYEKAIFFYREARNFSPSLHKAYLAEALLLAENDPGQARSLVNGVLENEPDHIDALLTATKIELLQRNPSESLSYIKKAQAIDPNNIDALWMELNAYELHLLIARLDGKTAEEKHFESALKTIDTAHSKSGQSIGEKAYIEFRRGKLFSAWRKKKQETISVLKNAANLAEQANNDALQLRILHSIRNIAIQRKNISLQQWALQELVELAPDQTPLHIELAQLRESVGEDGASVLQNLVTKRPNNIRSYLARARFLTKQKKYEEAILSLEQASERGVDPPMALAEIAKIYYLAPQFDHTEGDKITDRLEAEYPEHPGTLKSMALRERHRRQFETASEILKRLTDKRDDVEALHLLAKTLHHIYRNEDALSAINRAINVRGTFALPLHEMKASICYDSDRFHCTIASIHRILSNRGTADATLLVKYAASFYETGRILKGRAVLLSVLSQKNPPPDAAVELWRREYAFAPIKVKQVVQESFERHPQSYKLVNILTQIDIEESDTETALNRLNEVLANRRVPARTLLLRARVLAQVERYDDALRDAQHAFSTAPSLLEAAELITFLYKKKGRIEEAIRSLEDANDAGLLPPQGQIILGRLYPATGKHDKALQILERSLIENENQPSVKNDIAFLLASQNKQLAKAELLALDASSSMPKSAQVQDTLGLVYLKKGASRKAVKHFEQAIAFSEEKNETHPNHHYHYGLALEQLDRIEEAQKAHSMAINLDPNHTKAKSATQRLNDLQKAGNQEVSK